MSLTSDASAHDETHVPIQGGGSGSIEHGETHVVSVGMFNDSSVPEFRPKSLNLRAGDYLYFNFTTPLEFFTIVQAVSAEQPCTEKPDGIYVEGMAFHTIDPDGSKHAVNFGWVLPPVEGDVLYLYAAGLCETKDMRTTIKVDRTGWTGSLNATFPAWAVPSRDVPHGPLPAAGKSGIIAGAILFIMAITAAVAVLIFKRRARTKSMVYKRILPAAQVQETEGKHNVYVVSTETLPAYAESVKSVDDTKDKAMFV